MSLESLYVLTASLFYSIIFSIVLLLLFARTIGLWGIFSKIGIKDLNQTYP